MDVKNSDTQDDFLIGQSEVKEPNLLRLFLIGVLGVLLAEAAVMAALYFNKSPHPYWVDSLIDVVAIGFVVLPLFYYYAFKVLPAQITSKRRTEEILRKVLENLPIGVWIIDRYGKVQHGNHAAKEIWSGSRSVGIDQYGEYKAWWLDGKPVQPEEWGAAKAISRGETTLNDELEIEAFDGTHKFILNSTVPFYDEKKQLQGVVVVNKDITQRKRLEKELIENYELLDRYFSSIETLIAYMDRDFNFIRVNDSYALSAGYPAEYFTGKNHFELYPHPENQEIFQRVVDTGEAYLVQEKPFEYPDFPEKGITYWNWAVQPVRGQDGSVTGVVLSLIDVTERKRAQLKLEHQNKELQILSETEHRMRLLAEGLVEASIAVNSSLNLEDVLNRIIQSVQRTIPFHTSNILLVDGDQFKIAHHWDGGETPAHPPTFWEQYPRNRAAQLQEILKTNEPVLISRTISDPDWIAGDSMEWVKSYIAAPLIVDGKVIGVIDLNCEELDGFSNVMVNQLKAFAAPAATAIQNARNYSSEQNAREIAETLSAASLGLTQTLELHEVLDTLLEYIQRLVPFDGAYVFLVDGELRLTVRALLQKSPELSSDLALNSTYELWDESFLREVVTNKTSLNIPDTLLNPDWENKVEWMGARNWVGIPMVANDNTLGVVVLTRTVPGSLSRNHVRLAEVIVAQATVAIQNAWLFEQVSTGHERLQSLYHRLVEVQENERRFIARELHDDTSQALASTMIGLRLLEQDASLPESVRVRLTKQKEVIDTVLENLHRLAMNLRPATLDILGLIPTLEQLVKDFEEHNDLKIQFKYSGISDENRFSNETEMTIYRIVQEALNNVVRHAQTCNVDLILEMRDHKIIVVIEDNGVGYDTTEFQAREHLGLIGMKERAQMAGGTLQIESSPGGGTTVVVELPNEY